MRAKDEDPRMSKSSPTKAPDSPEDVSVDVVIAEPKPDTARTAYSIERGGNAYQVVTYLIDGGTAVEMDRSNPMSYFNAMSRIERSLLKMRGNQ